jgi:hypothetical protein
MTTAPPALSHRHAAKELTMVRLSSTNTVMAGPDGLSWFVTARQMISRNALLINKLDSRVQGRKGIVLLTRLRGKLLIDDIS